MVQASVRPRSLGSGTSASQLLVLAFWVLRWLLAPSVHSSGASASPLLARAALAARTGVFWFKRRFVRAPLQRYVRESAAGSGVLGLTSPVTFSLVGLTVKSAGKLYAVSTLAFHVRFASPVAFPLVGLAFKSAVKLKTVSKTVGFSHFRFDSCVGSSFTLVGLAVKSAGKHNAERCIRESPGGVLSGKISSIQASVRPPFAHLTLVVPTVACLFFSCSIILAVLPSKRRFVRASITLVHSFLKHRFVRVCVLLLYDLTFVRLFSHALEILYTRFSNVGSSARRVV